MTPKERKEYYASARITAGCTAVEIAGYFLILFLYKMQWETLALLLSYLWMLGLFVPCVFALGTVYYLIACMVRMLKNRKK